ncbi:MAG: HlyD family efflux transporter periplasmic adaptor subunit [Chloroflexi bacterium]|nr:HlyD family efflux transporter periplasmic adaptor subunit [Chloroflexota bacterium]
MRCAFVICLLALAACSGNTPTGAQQTAPTSTPIPTAPAVAAPTYSVQRGDVQNIFEYSGRWEPRDQEQLAFQVGGSVRRVNVRRGDSVTAGELLADLQIDDLENQLASAQLSLQSAIASAASSSDNTVESVTDATIALANANLSLQNAKNNLPWTSVSSAQLQLQTAQQSVENAQRAYDDAVSHPEAANAASAVDSAYQQLISAQNSLKSAQNSYYSSAQSFNNAQAQLKSQENSVIQAELNLQKAQQAAATGSTSDSVQSAQLNIDQIKAKIAQSSLYAAVDGVVLDVTIKPADSVTAYKAVITIGRPDPKEAIASLAFTDAQNLSVGMVGVCQVVNQPDTAVQCIVRRLPLSSQDADQTTRVAATLPDVAEGQLIDVQMPLEVSHDVLWLPPAAIRTFQSRTFVVLQTPDGPRSVDVVLGLQTDDRVEIKSGVNEGDVVIGQ